ncbi:hypothetical protein RLW55_05945 [Hyphomicrobium sp. B1]|uniref:hypothetical protein n=1 Tax=Hyphomicrobium sp. B1 TaxID=3075651 RepID=UPI003C2C101C
MKPILPLVLIAALAATAHAAVKTASGHYLLLHPAATIETDLGGTCVRVSNVSSGLVYLPISSAEIFNTALEAFPGVLKIEDCTNK